MTPTYIEIKDVNGNWNLIERSRIDLVTQTDEHTLISVKEKATMIRSPMSYAEVRQAVMNGGGV